jgi:hypothetical protein
MATTMSTSESTPAPGGSGRWADAQRLEGWAGEVRVNLVRLAAVLIFYGHHLVNVYLFRDQPGQSAYHAAVTALVLAWGALVLLVYFCLVRRWVPPALKYVVTAVDVVLITALLTLTRDPKTTLAVLYFLVIAAAALRWSLPLVYFATLGSIAGYLFFLGHVKFWLQLPDDQRLSRPNQVIFVLALGAAGILAGQVVRQVRRLAHGPAVVVHEPSEG